MPSIKGQQGGRFDLARALRYHRIVGSPTTRPLFRQRPYNGHIRGTIQCDHPAVLHEVRFEKCAGIRRGQPMWRRESREDRVGLDESGS